MSRPESLAAALLLGFALSGCAGGRATGRGAAAGEAPTPPLAVHDDAFAASLHKLLLSGAATSERSALLAGVVRRQLLHARERFAIGQEPRGVASVLGALYLVRAGESRRDMLDDTGVEALARATRHVAARGDEGRSLALMNLRAAVLPDGSPRRVELEAHRAALARWIEDTRKGGPMARLGAEQRAAAARSLLEPTAEALEEASRVTRAWIEQALELQRELGRRRPDRDEATEMFRALRSGGATLAALYLRHGDVQGAVSALETSSAKQIIPPPLLGQLRRAAEESRPSDWQELAAIFAQHQVERGEEFAIDAGLLEAAQWGTALEAYRRDPGHLETAGLVARLLQRLGMSEAAPIVLAGAVGPKPSPTALGTALRVTLEAILEEQRAEDAAAARRTYRAASALLAAAERPEHQGRVHPTPAELRGTMAAIEIRSGNLAGARPLLEAAATAEPSISAFLTIAVLDRQAGDPTAALRQLERALAAPDARLRPTDVAEAHLLLFEIHRDAGVPERAQDALAAALAAALSARSRPTRPEGMAHVEGLLARVLDRYGEAKGAARARERAFELAARSRAALATVMLDAIGQALVRRDVHGARAALRRGLEGALPEDDLVYGGLWLLLLERELGARPDGTSARALVVTEKRDGWPAKLAGWATGKLSDAELLGAARNVAQRTEAAFYLAMAKRVARDPAAEASLREVVRSPSIDLFEVRIARDLLATPLRAELPRGVTIP